MHPDSPASKPASSFHPGMEPVSGYRLLKFRDRGGVGEVWEAVGPDGVLVALKLVRLEQKGGPAELRAFHVIKGIRHPNLVAIFDAWQKSEFLIVAMELADRSLWDRLTEARKERMPGIPVAELLDYMEEAARGLDFLNNPEEGPAGIQRAGIQHRDIKPQNLLLVNGRVKIADFGLARILSHTVTRHTGIMTYAYAPPEFFNGQTSRHSDQYSLAITYCQLRGGRYPFPGEAAESMAGHLGRAPDLSMVPPAERPVVARALAKDPHERWPSCSDFVGALRHSNVTAGQSNDLGTALGQGTTDLGESLGMRPVASRAATVPLRSRTMGEDRGVSRKHRAALIGLALLLPVLGLGLYWWTTQDGEPRPESRYLPRPCRLFAAVNLRALHNSPVFRHWQEKEGLGAEEDGEWIRRFGVSREDVADIYIAGDLVGRPLVLLKARQPIVREDFVKALGLAGVQPQRVGNHELFTGPEEHLCLVSPRLVLAGDERTLRTVLEQPPAEVEPGSLAELVNKRQHTPGFVLLMDLRGLPEQHLVLDRLDAGKVLDGFRGRASRLMVEGTWGSAVEGKLVARGLRTDADLGAALAASGLTGTFQDRQRWHMKDDEASFRFEVPSGFLPLLQLACPGAYWSRVLLTGDPGRRSQALEQLGHKKDVAQAYLLRILRASEPSRRLASAEALGEIGTPAAVPDLLRQAREADVELKAKALAAACKLDSQRADVHLALLTALADPDPTLQKVVAAWLPKCAPLGKKELPALCALLKSGTSDARQAVIRALGEVGARCRHEGEVPELLYRTLLETLNAGAELQAEAERSLKKLRPFPAVDWRFLEPELKTGSSVCKQYLLKALVDDPAGPSPSLPLIRELAQKDADDGVRKQAVQLLAVLKTSADVKVWLQTLDDPQESVRLESIRALGKMGEKASAAVPALIDLAAEGKPELRVAAIQALGGLGAHARLARPVLALAGKSSSPEIQNAAAAALKQLGAPTAADVDFFVEVLKGEFKTAHRLYAAQLLLELGDQARAALPALQDALRDPEPRLRRLAAEFLYAQAAHAATAVPTLLSALDDADLRVRLMVLKAFAKLEPKPKKAVLFIARLVKDADKQVRLQALDTLISFGPQAKDAMATMALAVKDAESAVRSLAIKALGVFAGDNRTARLGLLEAMKDKETANRKQAAAILAKAGEPAVAGLQQLLDEPRDDVRLLAVEALAAIGKKAAPAADALVKRLDKEKSPEARVAIVMALGKTGSDEPAVLSALTDALKSEDKSVKTEAVRALGRLGPVAKNSAAQVSLLLRTADKDTYTEVAATLLALKLDTKEHVKFLIGGFRNSDDAVRRQIVQDLKKIGKPAIFPLQEQLDHRESAIRLGVVMTMAAFGPDAASCVRPLRKRFAVETEPAVAKEIVRAVQMIGGS